MFTRLESLKQAILSEDAAQIKKHVTAAELMHNVFENKSLNAVNFAAYHGKWGAIYAIMDVFPTSEDNVFAYRQAFLRTIANNHYPITLKLLEKGPHLLYRTDLLKHGFARNHFPLMAAMVRAHLARWADPLFWITLKDNPPERIIYSGGYAYEEEMIVTKFMCYFKNFSPAKKVSEELFDECSGLSRYPDADYVKHAKLWAKNTNIAIEKCILFLQIASPICPQDLHACCLLMLVIVLFKDLRLLPAWKFAKDQSSYNLVQNAINNIATSHAELRIARNAKAFIADYEASIKGVFGTASKSTKHFIVALKKALIHAPQIIQSLVFDYIRNRFNEGKHAKRDISLLLKHQLISSDDLDKCKLINNPAFSTGKSLIH